MTLEEHIENLKAMASDMPSDKCSDWIESLMAGINAMEELQAHREAWEKTQKEIEEYIGTHGNMTSAKTALFIVDKYRPKEGESNDSSND